MRTAELVGVDVGGTKTHMRVQFTDGSIDENIVPTARWRPIEQERDAGRLLQLLSDLCELTADTAVALGVHGCDARVQCTEFAESLAHASPARFHVVNDAELLVPAGGFPRGIGIVVGTGSIVVGQNQAGDLLTAGGWGWQLGDPGSAPALVRAAAADVLAASDAGPVTDPLKGELFAAFDVASERDLAYQLTESVDVHYWAGAASAVFVAARRGSALAHAVIDRGIDELVAEAATLRSRGAVGDAVVVGGGVIAGQPRFARTLCSRLTNALQLPAIAFDRAPVEGALALARRLHIPAQTTPAQR